MPRRYKKRKRRTYKRRKRAYRPKRRKYSRKRRTRLAPILNKKKVVKLRYVEEFELTPIVDGKFQQYVFRANSIQDPNLTGVGHQPMGHDQYELLYKSYNVLGSKITAKYFPKGTLNTAMQYCTILKSDDPIVGSTKLDINNNLENPTDRSAIKLIFPVTTTNKITTCTQTFSTKRDLAFNPLNHRTDTKFGDNPLSVYYYHVCVGALDFASGAVPTIIRVQIDYIVLLTDPQVVAQS